MYIQGSNSIDRCYLVFLMQKPRVYHRIFIEPRQYSHPAMHKTGDEDIWVAYGNVKIVNLLKQETMETDTLFWDQQKKMIYTHCFVKLTSPDFFAQGFGMESDDRATNAKILRPFDSYGYIKKDTLSNEEKDVSSRPNI